MRGQLYFPNKDESCHDPMTQGTVPILWDLRFKESIGSKIILTQTQTHFLIIKEDS